MKFYFIKTPNLIKVIFKNWIWSFSKKEKNIYLTFDDGPTPEVTEWVLNLLSKHNALATFFCIGKNIENHPEVFKKIISKGHTVGNHTHNHLNNWNTNNAEYLNNIQLTNNTLTKYTQQLNKLFRPPYGKIKLSTAKKIRKKGYRIVMWDVLSADFDTNINKEKCLQHVLDNTQKGSIIVFHDSKKAFRNLEYVLPKVLAFFSEKGFKFQKITSIN